jgi:MFS family permease
MMMSGGNLGGRLGWAAFSDRFGRRASFHLFTLGSVPLYLAVPFCVGGVVASGSVAPMWGFVAVTVAAISCMGGVYAILPAYEADLFGAKYVGPIHGRFLLASTAASLAGPAVLLSLRSAAEQSAVADLVALADPGRFEAAFGAPVADAADLAAAKTLTLARLLECCPPGTTDPSPFLYDSTMYTMAGFMGVAAASHALVKPVDPKHFERDEEDEEEVKPVVIVDVQVADRKK